jgi:elongation factor 1-gamma
MKIYGDKSDPLALRVLIAAKYNGVDIEVPAFNVGVDNKKPDFLNKSPLGKVPVLETNEGCIFESNAIARYVARQGKNVLYGSTPFEAGLIEQWIDFASNEIELPGAVWVFPILGFIPNNNVATQRAKGDIRKSLEVLNKHLQTRTFLVGHRISLADIVVSMALLRLYQRVLDVGFRKQFVNVNRWFDTVVHQPNVHALVGDVKLSEKMEVAPEAPETSTTTTTTTAPAKKETKPKEPKKEAPKKEAPQKEEEDEGEEEEKKEKKKPNPLDSLPPSKFVLDDWKRTYSNEETRAVALPWLWEHFDKEGYSIWFGDYKYNHELEKVFMTANLLGGFNQRLDKLRKYGFGSLIIFGDEPKLEISVCFLFRGQDIPAEMTDCDDYEHYDWRKADVSNEQTRELINDFFAWDGNFGGRKFNQGKIFK